MKQIVENYIPLPLESFTADHTLYVARNKNGYQTIYFCQFIELVKNTVRVRVLSSEHKWERNVFGTMLTVRKDKTALYGCSEGEKYARWHWWSKEGWR